MRTRELIVSRGTKNRSPWPHWKLFISDISKTEEGFGFNPHMFSILRDLQLMHICFHLKDSPIIVFLFIIYTVRYNDTIQIKL